jgi:type IV pilus assembly protein PilY1
MFLRTVTALVSLLATSAAMAQVALTNQDIDLFMVNPGTSTKPANVLILLDNTANWNIPFAAEKQALVNVVSGAGTTANPGLSSQFRVGLMLFPETGSPNDNIDGGYVRYAVRDMTDTNKTAFSSLINDLDKLGDKGNNATFSLLMYEAYAYFAGIEARSGYGKVKRDVAAFQSATSPKYVSPIIDACQKNFIIVISNGPASDNSSSLSKAQQLLSGIQGSAPTQINIAAPNDGMENNWTDEYARYMATGDCNAMPGVQRVITYTIEVNPGTNKTDLAMTALMQSTATSGKGRYFAVSAGSGGTDGTQLAAALQSIFTEIQAVNSVFASTTLPVSVNVRGTNANQVYMGIFRPDSAFAPRWFGNMKLYKVGVDTTVSPPDLYLADASVPPKKAESADTGFIIPDARSFWTHSSSFWSFRGTYDDTDIGRESDLPDGPYVEKGGAAQQLRDVAPSARRLFTCAGGCSSGAALSHLFDDANNAITAAALGAASASERTQIIKWTRGEDLDDENKNGSNTDARASIHGDVLHSRPAVVNYNRSGSNDDNDVFVFYGANDGVLHAIEGGFDSGAGRESWGFVAPEHFSKLKRLRENTPLIGPGYKKPYFFDGGITVYTHDVNRDGKLVAADGDQVLLFVTMRRGGRSLYAFDVSDPVNPKFLWKKGCPNETGNSGCDSGYEGLGQTWSDPTVTFLRAFTKPVIVMGMGYDAPVEDVAPCLTTSSSATAVGTLVDADVTYNLDGTCTISGGTAQTINRSMGRGVLVIDALTGAVLASIGSEPGATLTVSGMDYAIAGEVVALNRDRDTGRTVVGTENIIGGYADRLYAGDTGGNIWRVDVSDPDASKWTASRLAALGGSGVVPRKFLHRVDVVYGSDANGKYDAVLIGSGDREHPFDMSVQNRFYMIKDRAYLPTAPATALPTINEADLYDASADCLQECTGTALGDAQAALLAASGWYFDLHSGEKVVGAATTISGNVFFNTNQPSSTACASTLGIAREYEVNYIDATAVRDLKVDGVLTDDDRSAEHAGGGLLPEPVPILVEINDENYQGVVSGPSVREVDTLPIGARLRTYWHKQVD